MSASLASGTVKYSCSVPESITLIVSCVEGSTHSPPMKKRSGWLNGTSESCTSVIFSSPALIDLAPAKKNPSVGCASTVRPTARRSQGCGFHGSASTRLSAGDSTEHTDKPDGTGKRAARREGGKAGSA